LKLLTLECVQERFGEREWALLVCVLSRAAVVVSVSARN
jgi:hypothetical protein